MCAIRLKQRGGWGTEGERERENEGMGKEEEVKNEEWNMIWGKGRAR